MQSVERVLAQNYRVGIPLKEISDELGYCDTYAFCKQFKQQLGLSPGKFKANFSNR